jgi:hypothetical protein
VVEAVGDASSAQKALDHRGRRLDALGGREDSFEPDQQVGRCGAALLDLETADQDQFVAREVVGAPVGTVREDADVTLSDLLSASADVPVGLFLSILEDLGAAQIPLRLDSREADLDVDPAAVSDLGLQVDTEVVLVEVLVPFEQQLPDIGLESRLGPQGFAVDEPGQRFLKAGLWRCGHATPFVETASVGQGDAAVNPKQRHSAVVD